MLCPYDQFHDHLHFVPSLLSSIVTPSSLSLSRSWSESAHCFCLRASLRSAISALTCASTSLEPVFSLSCKPSTPVSSRKSFLCRLQS